MSAERFPCRRPPPRRLVAPHHPELLGEVARVQHRQRRPLPDPDVAHPLRLREQLRQGEERAAGDTRDAVGQRLDAIRPRIARSTPRDGRADGLTDGAQLANVCSMPRDTTKRISSQEARRQARIANGKDADDLSDVYRGRPTRPKKLKPVDRPPNPYVPAPPLSLADAASQLGVRLVQLAQAIQEGKVATVRGRGGDLLIAHDELGRVRREGPAT